MNPDSIVSVYAPDPEAYDVFRLFDPLIEDYDGFRTDDVHCDLDWGKPEKLSNLYPRGEHVVLMRIRCVKSIKGYPFNSAMDEIHYREQEWKTAVDL